MYLKIWEENNQYNPILIECRNQNEVNILCNIISDANAWRCSMRKNPNEIYVCNSDNNIVVIP